MAHVRIDVFMASKGYVPSRTKAQDAIRAGLVFIQIELQLRQVRSPSEILDDENPPQLVIQANPDERYVSRAGLKMEGALEELLAKIHYQVDGLKVLDVGISTGGFSDCLLQRGAASVVGVDVGHGQLSAKLKADPRICAFEGINARTLDKNSEVLSVTPPGGFDLIVIDVSFISLSLILPAVLGLLKKEGSVLALVKPQFEVGPSGLNKKGIVKLDSSFLEVRKKIESCVMSFGAHRIQYFESRLEGKDGNKEFFIYFQMA